MGYLLTIDQGTTSTRALVINELAQCLASVNQSAGYNGAAISRSRRHVGAAAEEVLLVVNERDW